MRQFKWMRKKITWGDSAACVYTITKISVFWKKQSNCQTKNREMSHVMNDIRSKVAANSLNVRSLVHLILSNKLLLWPFSYFLKLIERLEWTTLLQSTMDSLTIYHRSDFVASFHMPGHFPPVEYSPFPPLLPVLSSYLIRLFPKSTGCPQVACK